MYKCLLLCGLLSICQGTRSVDIKPVEVDKDGFKLKLVFIAVRGGEYIPAKRVFNATALQTAGITEATFEGHEFDDIQKDGRERLFDVGQNLRKRYANFLGEKNSYSDDEVAVQSLNYTSLTKSIQFVKKGLEDQKKYRSGESKLSDDEIKGPYEDTKEIVDDFQRYRNRSACPAFAKALEPALDPNNYKNSLKAPLENLPDELKDAKYNDLHLIHEIGAMAKKIRKAPSWFDDNMEKALKNLNEVYLRKLYSTNKLRRLSGGRIVSDVKNDIENLIKKEFKPENRKMFLFGATSSFMSALVHTYAGKGGYYKNGKRYYVEYPDYGATHIAEAYEKKGNYYFKFYYDKDGKGITSENEIQIQSCVEESGYCSFDRWVKELKNTWLTKQQAEKECKEVKDNMKSNKS